ncbi:DUF1385 domain-containing protein [Miltoncostaea marina]|uniref:DUF1385 domain-containing protein n=1 Tax=Miltoncostaea marina TaxID=2843215 RepID=UPI001C3E227F|nr:DUF1385 domain-containing protein [Miltoncostaea marina]
MRTRDRVGIAVRREQDGVIVTEGFPVEPPSGRWARWPFMRGVVAIRTALTTGQKAMSISERLRWEEVVPEGEEPGPEDDRDDTIGFWGKVAIGAGALLGAGVQIAAFRIGPIVIAKEAGLEGAAFIVADAAIRLVLMLGMLLLLSLLPPFRKILKYHGAEHQAIAAHEARAPLTAAAAAGFSRFHPRCGTSFLVVSAVVSIAVYGAVLAITGVFTYPALIATRLLGAPIVTAIAFELQRQAAMRAEGRLRFLSWPGMWAQGLTTAPPDPPELEVACAALATALEAPEAEPAVAEAGAGVDAERADGRERRGGDPGAVQPQPLA